MSSAHQLINMDPIMNTEGRTVLDQLNSKRIQIAAAKISLEKIISVIRKHQYASQTRILSKFLGSLYNSYDFQFPLAHLREIDSELEIACMAVLHANSLGVMDDEIHHWGVFAEQELLKWLVEHGHRAESERMKAVISDGPDFR